MTKTIKHDPCTTDGMPHEWRYDRRYQMRHTLQTVFVSKCSVCGKEKHRGGVNRRDNDMIDREVAA